MRAQPAIDVHRAADRFWTRTDWLCSAHSFSFGAHYDPDNTAYGVLVASNDDVVQPDAGFATHPHRDMEIVTWVLDGSLVHRDSTGRSGVVYPGLAQRMSAGSGVEHAETNDAWRLGDWARRPVRFVQMWVVPDERGLQPAYEQREVALDQPRGALVPVASGMAAHDGEAAIRIANRAAALHVGRLDAGQHVTLPDAPYVHLFVARGAAELEAAGPISEGDAVRLTASPGRRLTATAPAELLVWEMHASLGPARHRSR